MTTGVWVTTNSPAVVGQGFLVKAGDDPLELTIEKYGNIVTKAWYGIDDTSAKDIVIIEGFLPLDKGAVIDG